MSKSPSKRESSASTSGSRSNGPLLDFTEDEIIRLSLPDLVRIMERRGLTPEQTALINRRRQFLRNRQHAVNRRNSLPSQEYVDYESSDEVIQSQPLTFPSGSQSSLSIGSEINKEDKTVNRRA